MTTIPRPQPLIALDLANETRFARAALKRDVKAGTLSIRDALELDCARRMRVMDVLTAQHMCGPYRARKLLRAAGCSERVLVSQLTTRQRELLGGEA